MSETSSTPAIAPEKTAPAALWAVAEHFLNILYNLFGPPERIAFQHTLTKAPYQLLLVWLRAGEALLRRLLIIEAAAFPKPNTPPRLWPKHKRRRRLIGFDDDKPEMWRVSFRCFSSPVYGGSVSAHSRADDGGDVATASAAPTDRYAITSPVKNGGGKFFSAWPLAERYEALLRVFADPAPYARRLAARLHALPHRLQEVLRLPKRRRERKSGEPADIPDLIGRPSFERIEAAALDACPAFDSS